MFIQDYIATLPINILVSIGILIIVSTILAYIAKLSKQPLIPAYIITGILLGPLVLGVIKDVELINGLSEIGIMFLLFFVGLDINLKKLKDVGLVALVGGILQMLFVFLAGYFVAISLGFASIVSIYLGLVMAFSSTMVVVKLLVDNQNIDTLHGRIILGILLLQDLVAMIVLAVLCNNSNFSFSVLGYALLKCFGIIVLAFLCSKFIFPYLFRFASKSKELLFLSSVSICFLFALIAYLLHFSISIGAFVAGIALATLPYTVDIKGRVEPIKDFFATIFFISLGAQLVFVGLSKLAQPMILFLLIILLLKPLIVFLLCSLFGYGNNISFLSGISLGQISEFSLILIIQGLMLGQVPKEIFSLTIILAVLTIAMTSYLIKYSLNIHRLFTFLKFFDKISLMHQNLNYNVRKGKKSILLLGCSRMGTIFIKTLRSLHEEVVVVDHDPSIIKNLIKHKISCMYGDGTSREVLDSIGLRNVKIIISTIPDVEDNIFILEYAKIVNPKVIVIATANHVSQAFKLYDFGADYVIVPHVLSGEKMSSFLKDFIVNNKDIKVLRKNHLDSLSHLENLGLN